MYVPTYLIGSTYLMLGPLPWHYHRRYVAASANWVGAGGAPSRPVFMQKDIG